MVEIQPRWWYTLSLAKSSMVDVVDKITETDDRTNQKQISKLKKIEILKDYDFKK